MNVLCLDFETTTKNHGHVFTPENYAVSYVIKRNNGPPVFKYFTDLDFSSYLAEQIKECGLFIGFNCKFDLLWLRRMGLSLPRKCTIWDCSLAEFILSGQTLPYVSLDESLASYGLALKKDVVKEYWDLGIDTPDIPREVLEEYNNRDVEATYELYLQQQLVLSEAQKKLTLLEGEDMKTLMEAEWNGTKWDMGAADYALRCYIDDRELTRKKLWEYVPQEARKYFNWDSGDDLSALLYGGLVNYNDCTEEDSVYKTGPRTGEAYVKRSWYLVPIEFPKRFKPLERTLVKKCSKEGYKGTLFYQVDDPTLKQLTSRRKEDKELLTLLDSYAKTAKVVEMLEELFKLTNQYHWQDSLLHGQYNQNVVRTGRLSSSRPNQQNKPPEIDEYLVSRYAH